MYRPQGETRVAKQINRVFQDATDAELSAVAALVTAITSYWGLLLQPARDKLAQYIRNTPNQLVLPGLATLALTAELAPIVQEKIATLNLEELAIAINTFGLKSPAKERVLQLIFKVRSFNSANDVLNRTFLPLFDEFTKDDFVRLIRSPTSNGADLIGATVYTNVLKRLQGTSIFERVELNQLLDENNALFLLPDLQ